MNLSIHPFFLIAALAAVVAVGAAFLAFRTRRLTQRILLAVVTLLFALPALYLFTVLHPELVDARFRAYKAFYQDIREGMTRDDVLALLDRRYPQDGPRQRPKVLSDAPTNLGFFMNPETFREPNCENIFLTLADGRVTRKVYTAD